MGAWAYQARAVVLGRGRRGRGRDAGMRATGGSPAFLCPRPPRAGQPRCRRGAGQALCRHGPRGMAAASPAVTAAAVCGGRRAASAAGGHGRRGVDAARARGESAAFARPPPIPSKQQRPPLWRGVVEGAPPPRMEHAPPLSWGGGTRKRVDGTKPTHGGRGGGRPPVIQPPMRHGPFARLRVGGSSPSHPHLSRWVGRDGNGTGGGGG